MHTVKVWVYYESESASMKAVLVFDKQDYDAMVKLVQTLEMLPTCDLATQPMIQFHFAFALNRYRRQGNACIVSRNKERGQYVEMKVMK